MAPIQTPKAQVPHPSLLLIPPLSDIPDRQAKKEAKRLEKEAKLAAKNATKAATAPKPKDTAPGKKDKVKDEETAFVNTTPKGQKKGALHPTRSQNAY
jgi:valyl-tRNA synthetase